MAHVYCNLSFFNFSNHLFVKKMLQAKGKQRFFFMKKSNSCTVIECSIIHVYLLLFFSYISYHKSLDNEQRPMIHYAIFFYCIIFILYISVEVVVTYILLSLAFVQVWNRCLPRDIGFSVGNECWIYKTKNLHCIISVFFVYPYLFYFMYSFSFFSFLYYIERLN